MGEHEDWAQPSGLLPNEAAGVARILDAERWLKAEERTAELIACIQPNPPSEELRNAVANYVQRIIMKCFSCQIDNFLWKSVLLSWDFHWLCSRVVFEKKARPWCASKGNN